MQPPTVPPGPPKPFVTHNKVPEGGSTKNQNSIAKEGPPLKPTSPCPDLEGSPSEIQKQWPWKISEFLKKAEEARARILNPPSSPCLEGDPSSSSGKFSRSGQPLNNSMGLLEWSQAVWKSHTPHGPISPYWVSRKPEFLHPQK